MEFQYTTPITETDCNEILLGCCSNEWESSARLIGTAMRIADERHHVSVGDLVFEERLRHLGSLRKVEIDEPSLPYGRYQVRLPQSSGIE